jgi:hypothetical protein
MYEAAASCKDIAWAPIKKLGTPMCNVRRILLRRDARDESLARNSVSCQSLATLWRYGTRQRYKCVPTFRLSGDPEIYKKKVNLSTFISQRQ